MVKSPDEIERIRAAGRICRSVLTGIQGMIAPGVSTGEIDGEAERLIRQAGMTPAFKGYRGFPATLCVSVNDEVIHGIPGPRRLAEGDVVSLDIGVSNGGYIGDCATTAAVGAASDARLRLMAATREALAAGIAQVRSGNRIGDISSAVQAAAEARGFSVIRDFAGHGVGRAVHEPPEVPNFGRPGRGEELRAGMVIAIEPMVVEGSPAIRILPDGWTTVTRDGGCAAHYEETVLVTDDGADILTEAAHG